MACYGCGGEGGSDVQLCPKCRESRRARRDMPAARPELQTAHEPGSDPLAWLMESLLAKTIVALLIVGGLVIGVAKMLKEDPKLVPVLRAGASLGARAPQDPAKSPQQNAPHASCRNVCGDGVCNIPMQTDEGICVGDGCPCDETPTGCPADCGAQLCENRCGNGKCARMPCHGRGCACPETYESCPSDCCKPEYSQRGARIIRQGCFDE